MTPHLPRPAGSLHRRHRFVAALCAVLILGPVLGCQHDETPSVIRLIEHDPVDVFEPLAAETLCETVLTDFRTPGALNAWQLRHLDVVDGASPGMRLRSRTRDPQLIRDQLQIDADRVDVVRVELEQLDEGAVQLFWAAEDEGFSADRSMNLQAHQSRSGVFAFHVVEHPAWKGTVNELRVDPGTSEKKEVTLVRISTARHCAPSRARQAIHARPWKVEINGTMRNALASPPGLAVRHQVTVGPGSTFAAGIAVTPQLRTPTTMSVTVIGENGDRQLVLAHHLEPTSPLSGWTDVTADLENWVGQRVTLELTAETDGVPPKDMGIPFWANARVVTHPQPHRPPNVLLISVDTLRADHLSVYGYEHETTPNIDRWARSGGVVFQDAVAPSPWTHPSHVSMLTGLDSLHHGHNHGERVAPGLQVLAERLRRSGYATWALTGGLYLSPEWGFEQGFDRFTYWQSPDSEAELTTHVDQAIEMLNTERDRPFFLFLHTYEVHVPFRPRQPHFSRFAGTAVDDSLVYGTRKEPLSEQNGYMKMCRIVRSSKTAAGPDTVVPWDATAQVVAAYDAGVAHMDEQLGRLLDYLDRSGLDANTVVILTSDHGEALGEKNLANHTCLYDFLLRVPLIIAGPGVQPRRQNVRPQVRLIDIVPTILDLVGLPPAENVDGVSLRPTLTGGSQPAMDAWSYAATTNYGLALRTADRSKLIFNNSAWSAVRGEVELYDLSTDPNELSDLADVSPTAANLTSRVVERLRKGGSGLELCFDNPGSSRVEFLIDGDRVDETRVKSPGKAGATVSLKAEGLLQVAVEASSSFCLLLEGADPGGITLTQAFGDRASWQIAPTDGAAVISARSDNESVVTVSTSWRRVNLDSADRVIPSSEMADQLRALGYVE